MKILVDEDGLVKHQAKEIRRERALEITSAIGDRFEELRQRDIPSQFMTVELDQHEIELLKEFNRITEEDKVRVYYSDSHVDLSYRRARK
jgi:hypothetical protein